MIYCGLDFNGVESAHSGRRLTMNSTQQKTLAIADQGCLLNLSRVTDKPGKAPVALRITATVLEVTRFEIRP